MILTLEMNQIEKLVKINRILCNLPQKMKSTKQRKKMRSILRVGDIAEESNRESGVTNFENLHTCKSSLGTMEGMKEVMQFS